MVGVLPPEEPRCVRLDVAVDVTYGDPGEAQRVLEGLTVCALASAVVRGVPGSSPPHHGRDQEGAPHSRPGLLSKYEARERRCRWGKLRFETEQTV